MVKYSIEGNIDFFKELNEIQNNESDTINDDKNECLLTGEKLRPDSVILLCGHRFNYKPLFTEVVMQKCSFLPKNIASSIVASYVNLSGSNANYGINVINTNTTPNTNPNTNNNTNTNTNNNITVYNYNSSVNMETTKLSYNEIKCPYCRSITQNLLPYYPYPEIKQIRYVNSPSSLCMSGVKCGYYGAKHIDKECNNAPIYDETYGLTCKTHLRMFANAVTTRLRSKAGLVHSTEENVIVSSSANKKKNSNGDNAIDGVCSYILVSGNRKGHTCGLKPYEPNEGGKGGMDAHNNNQLLCKRHYNKVFALELPGKICKGHKTGDGLLD